MKNKVVLFILLSQIFSCTSDKVTEDLLSGSYSYRSFNIAGELIGDGTFFIRNLDSNFFEGNWSIRNIRNCIVCGPQYGSGFLTGEIITDSIYINLNPNTPQNYVELVGNINGDTLSGDWHWFESVLNSNRGMFEAVRM